MWVIIYSTIGQYQALALSSGWWVIIYSTIGQYQALVLSSVWWVGTATCSQFNLFDEAHFTSAVVTKCFTETQPESSKSKQCPVARKNSLEGRNLGRNLERNQALRGGQSSSCLQSGLGNSVGYLCYLLPKCNTHLGDAMGDRMLTLRRGRLMNQSAN